MFGNILIEMNVKRRAEKKKMSSANFGVLATQVMILLKYEHEYYSPNTARGSVLDSLAWEYFLISVV